MPPYIFTLKANSLYKHFYIKLTVKGSVSFSGVPLAVSH